MWVQNTSTTRPRRWWSWWWQFARISIAANCVLCDAMTPLLLAECKNIYLSILIHLASYLHFGNLSCQSGALRQWEKATRHREQLLCSLWMNSLKCNEKSRSDGFNVYWRRWKRHQDVLSRLSTRNPIKQRLISWNIAFGWTNSMTILKVTDSILGRPKKNS